MRAHNRPHDLSINAIYSGMEVCVRRVVVVVRRVVAVSLNPLVVVES